VTDKRTKSRALTLTVLVLHGCGGGKTDDKPSTAKHDAGPPPIAAPIAIPKSGVDRIDRMNFVWGSVGSRDYGKALAAYATKGKPRDWTAIKNHTETALTKDPQHLGAHWLLASALAQLGDHAAAVDHLVFAISSDYYKYGVALDTAEDLKPFVTTKHGAAVRELAAKIRDDYKARVAKAILVIARRSPFRWPDKSSPHESTSRGELYAYDRDTRHYLRLTHTNDQVVGYVRATNKSELAILTYDRMDRVAPNDSPVITRAAILTLDADFNASPKAVIDEPMREIAIGYAPGDNLLVTGTPVKGGDTVYSYNSGKLVKVGLAPPLPRIVFSLEDGRVVRVPTDVKASWTGDPPHTNTLEINGKKIPIAESGAASQSSISLAPTKYAAFATAVDPCAKDVAPSLYVVDLEKGKQSHVLSAKSHFLTRWVDATTLAYEDGEGQIRLWDATAAKQLPNPLVNKAGISLDVLSLAGPHCKARAADVGSGSGSGDGSGSEPPLPPEE
jgi:hypothetical protein